MGVRLAGPASSLTIRPINLDHPHTPVMQMASQSRAVTAGSFDTDHHDRTERHEPISQRAIPVRGRRERRGAQQPATVVQRGCDMHIEMGVDPTRDLCSHIRVFSCCSNQ
jgi:hypothetical protein